MDFKSMILWFQIKRCNCPRKLVIILGDFYESVSNKLAFECCMKETLDANEREKRLSNVESLCNSFGFGNYLGPLLGGFMQKIGTPTLIPNKNTIVPTIFSFNEEEMIHTNHPGASIHFCSYTFL